MTTSNSTHYQNDTIKTWRFKQKSLVVWWRIQMNSRRKKRFARNIEFCCCWLGCERNLHNYSTKLYNWFIVSHKNIPLSKTLKNTCTVLYFRILWALLLKLTYDSSTLSFRWISRKLVVWNSGYESTTWIDLVSQRNVMKEKNNIYYIKTYLRKKWVKRLPVSRRHLSLDTSSCHAWMEDIYIWSCAKRTEYLS
jgi:hypothetical protein